MMTSRKKNQKSLKLIAVVKRSVQRAHTQTHTRTHTVGISRDRLYIETEPACNTAALRCISR